MPIALRRLRYCIVVADELLPILMRLCSGFFCRAIDVTVAVVEWSGFGLLNWSGLGEGLHHLQVHLPDLHLPPRLHPPLFLLQFVSSRISTTQVRPIPIFQAVLKEHAVVLTISLLLLA